MKVCKFCGNRYLVAREHLLSCKQWEHIKEKFNKAEFPKVYRDMYDEMIK